MRMLWARIAMFSLTAVVVACADDGGIASLDASERAGPGDGDGDTEAEGDGTASGGGNGLALPEAYTFLSRFEAGQPSATYAGQVMRHLLIADLKAHVVGLTDAIDRGDFQPGEGDVVEALEFFYAFDSASSGAVEIGLSIDPATKQSVYDDVSTDKDLSGKIAGNDATGQYRDWMAGMPGWGDGNLAPDELVRQWFGSLDALAVERTNGEIPLDPGGEPIAQVYVTPAGQNLAELLQKFLLGAVAFSQGADDYLDDDLEGKGLNSDNAGPDGDAPFTPLEHAWDEGFGYFGAARDYGDYTDDEAAGKGGRQEYASGFHDADDDGSIDLTSEYNFGHSQNASKRDRGTSADAETDFSGDAFGAFLRGRAIITGADGPLDDRQMSALQAQRDIAVGAWERAIAATAVHYINEVLVDMGAFDTDGYNFLDHAKHWSELKGFALSLQFNRRSPMLDDFAGLHERIGDAPALPSDGDADDYRAGLLEARDLLADAYGFHPDNIGDHQGENGW